MTPTRHKTGPFTLTALVLNKGIYMKLILIWLLCFLPQSVLAQNTSKETSATITPGFYSTQNYTKNPSCHRGTTNITQSVSIVTRNTSNVYGDGISSCQLAGTGTGQTVTFDANTFVSDAVNRQCQASFSYSGTPIAWKAYVKAGVSTLSAELTLNGALTSSPNFIVIPFPCGSLGSTPQLVFESTSGSPGTLYVAKVYIGIAIAGTVTVQKFTSGSGTYNTPAGVRYLGVKVVGGGGGGGGSGNSATAGSTGGTTTFGTSMFSAVGGSGGAADTNGGAGGTATLGTGPIGTAIQGGRGQGGAVHGVVGVLASGGSGASSPFGGAGGGGPGLTGGYAAIANSGSGGGGGGSNGNTTGAGGGAGGYAEGFITGTSMATSFPYAVGASGGGGSAGTSGFAGGAGGSGYIEVTEYY